MPIQRGSKNWPILLACTLAVLGLAGCGSSSTRNLALVASDVCNTTPVGIPWNSNLASSVTAPAGVVLNFSLATPPSKGTATIDVTGEFTYAPNFGGRGTDSFSYRVEDLSGGQDVATVTVIIGDTRIMPLGDSITEGVTGGVPASQEVGYRRKLYNDLTAAGYKINFVGSLSNGASANPPIADPHHEGHAGFEDSQVATAVFGWLDANPADIVLLHIGTNPTVIDTSPNDVKDILDQIDLWETVKRNPITVFVARTIDRNPVNPDVEVYNNNVQAMALARVNDNIVIVNQHDALTYPDDLGSQPLHPIPTGYEKMATEWLEAVTNSGAVPKCP